MADRTPQAALGEIAAHPRGDDLARVVHTVAFAAADERRTSLGRSALDAAERLGLERQDAETSFGNVLAALEAADAAGLGQAGRALLSACVARGVALSPPESGEAEERVAEELLWLSAHTPADAFPALDVALEGRAAGIWEALGRIVRRIEEGQAPTLGRGEALLAAASLLSSESAAARAQVEAIAAQTRDPALARLVGEGAPARGAPQGASGSGSAGAAGELVSPPRDPVLLVLMALTGVLVVTGLWRLVRRYVLGWRQPATLDVSGAGIRVKSETSLLGRTIRSAEIHIPVDGVVRASREIRYPRLPLYAGVAALAVGSYAGAKLFVDGARTGSPELLGVGAIVVVVGLAIDYALTHVWGSARGRCRVVIVPRKGRALALGELDPSLADAALSRLTERATSA